MSRITKELANRIAIKLTETKLKEIEKLNLEAKKLNTEYAIKELIPKDVLSCFKKHKGFFNKSNSMNLSGGGFSYKTVYLSETLPYENGCVNPKGEYAKAINVLLNDIEKKETERRNLIREIENALINLRTYAKIEKEFNEAFKYLPVNNNSMALVVNIDSIRKKL